MWCGFSIEKSGSNLYNLCCNLRYKKEALILQNFSIIRNTLDNIFLFVN